MVLLALALVALVVGAQEEPKQAPSALTLDELIARLPRVGEEWDPGVEPRRLVPLAQEFRERLARGSVLSSAQWLRALRDTGVLSHRARWPVDVPFTVSMRPAGWFDRQVLTLLPREPGALAAASVGQAILGRGCAYGWMRMTERARHQELGRLELGPHRLSFEVDLPRGSSAGTLTLDVEVVATLDEALPPVSSPMLDDAVRRSLALELEDTRVGPQFFLRRAPRASDELTHLAIALELELREAGVGRATTAMREGVDKVSVPLPAALAASPEARAGWSLRVRGVTADVLELWWFERRWGGELELPLEDWLTARAPR